MKKLLIVTIALSSCLFACRDNEAPAINMHVPSDESFHSNDANLGVAFDLLGAEDLTSLIYSLRNTSTDSTYISGDWMDISYTVDYIVVRDYLNIHNLPEGKYDLEVEARDDRGNFNSAKVCFNILD